ncbi:MAG: hypothetical protein CL878_03255 [Dehalococcoidia bacterium]|nr:hypothetical protein [Dehalococcoidia bacterium]
MAREGAPLARRAIPLLPLSAIAVSFTIWARLFIYRTSFVTLDGRRSFSLFDDAMISLRYAWNLTHGLGLVWNAGERVEGYTNLLMTLFMSLFTLAFSKPMAVLMVQIAGLVLLLGNAVVLVLIARELSWRDEIRQHTTLSVLAFLGALAYYPLAYWSLLGMETGLLTLLLSLSILSAFRYGRAGGWLALYGTAALLGLAYLTRPDSVVPASLILLYILWEVRRSQAGRLVVLSTIGVLALYLVFPVAQALFRWSYYGELLPNTYLLRLVGVPLAERISNGIGFNKGFFQAITPLLVIAGIGVVFNFRKEKLLLTAPIVALVGYQIGVGGDPWPYWRLLAPAIPLLLVAVSHEVVLLAGLLVESAPWRDYLLRNPIVPSRHVASMLAALVVLLLLYRLNAPFMEELVLLQRPFQTDAQRANVNTAVLINKVTSCDATVGVLWAGAIPYYSGRMAVDFLGKSDRHIARLPPDLSGAVAWSGMSSVPGHNKYDLTYSIGVRQPTFVQQFQWGRQDLSDWTRSRYVEVHHGEYRLYLRKGSPAVHWDLLVKDGPATYDVRGTALANRRRSDCQPRQLSPA